MNARILNREFQHPSDGWYQIEPKGYHPARIGKEKVVQVIDDKAINAMATRFNTEASAGTLRHGNEMLIDHEHFSSDPNKETEAYGWMQESQARGDGVYARNRWTDTGKPKVDGGSYRFFSTEYDPEQTEEVPASEVPEEIRNKFKGHRFLRPLRLDGLTLTNMPNNRGQRPITNRGDDRLGKNTLPDDPANPTAREEADTKRKQKMKLIANRLGLSADASEEAILGELDKVIKNANGVNIVTTERDTLKNRVTELEKTTNDLQVEIVDGLMDACGIKEDDKIRNRLRPALTPMKNREERIEALADFGFELGGAKAEERPTQTKLHNREGKQPEQKRGSSAKGDEKEIAERIRNRATELHGAAPGRGFNNCWEQAQREILRS
jgi:phage I-like protein